MRRFFLRAFLASLPLPAVFALAQDARACGGTFCDTGPRSMPVDQTGENILFVMGNGIVEAHVQIQYQGDPAKFAWVVPMQQKPDVTVGSQALFDALLSSTVPSYGFTTQRDQCGAQSQNAKGSSVSFDAPNSGVDAGVAVISRKQVGSFEVTVLQGGTAQEVVTWLDTNGYQQADAAPALLQKYVDKSFFFAAIKLTAGAGIDEIHPLVFSYAGGEPCVPLELTAIAAVENMGVRTFFLGQHRVVPVNYRHVLVNPLKIDWSSLGANYRDVIAKAVDVKRADGQAFVTEYAGPSAPAAGRLPQEAWTVAPFSSATPPQALAELQRQGLGGCQNGSCSFQHPLVLPLLEEFLPPPAGVRAEDYYSCLSCFAGQVDVSLWDVKAFATALGERIIQPAQHAVDVLSQNHYLTRMFTLISPYEMTLDPIFREEQALPDVPLPGLATQRILCNGQSSFTLPDGQEVLLDASGRWPTFDGMSTAERIESFDLPGGARLLVDNRPAINDSLSAHNDTLRGPSGCLCDVPSRQGDTHGALAALGLAAALLGRRRRFSAV
jgi:MYXO-CTERM domain-containing protein